jgi:hypothetical protein
MGLLTLQHAANCSKEIDGRVAEWSIAPVLKTGVSKGTVSSNLTSSAIIKPQAVDLLGAFSFWLMLAHLAVHLLPTAVALEIV